MAFAPELPPIALVELPLPTMATTLTEPALPRVRNPWVIIGAVMVGYFLGPLYSSVANVALPNLVAAFGSDIDTMQWVVTGYMLGYSVTMPVAGWLADAFGRRRIFMLGVALFTVSSVMCALAWDAPSLILFRILQAVGGGLISPTAMAIITDVVPMSQRGREHHAEPPHAECAPAFGPVISGWIIDNLDDWRLIFSIGVPIGIAGCVLAFVFIPRDEDRTTAQPPFDTAGALLLSTSLATLLIPLSQGDRLGWDDSWIQFSFVLSAFTFVGFIWRELTAKHPMLDLTLFRKTTFAVSVGLRAAMGMGYYVPIFLLPLFTQDVMGWPPTISGLLLVPGGLATAFLMPVSGWLSDKIGSRVLVFAGMGLAAVGTFMFAHLDIDWTPNHIALDMMVRSAALGLLFTPLTTAALSVVPRKRTGGASGILNTVWQVAGSLGIALGQTYLTNRTAIHLSENAGGVTQARGVVHAALGTIGAFLGHNGIPPSATTTVLAQMSGRIANVQAYGDTFVFAAIVLALATPLALLLTRGRAS
jgi:EmrB/QacA subfamily drug resistance transporter